MEPTPPPFNRKFGVDQVALDLFSAEGAPCPAEPPAACVALPRPLWRKYEPLDEADQP